MGTILDPYVFQINIAGGREQPDLPGLSISRAPRRAQRERMDDLLILLLTISGDADLPSRKLQEFKDTLVSTYYNTPGPVTTGLTAVVNKLNELLLKENLSRGLESQQTQAKLNLAVLRRGQLYLSHGGDTHSIVCQADRVEHYHNADAIPKTLGLGRSVNTRFFTHSLQPGGVLLLSTEPSDHWTPAMLFESYQLPPDHLRRRLLIDAVPNLQAVVIRFQPGKGDIHHLQHRDLLSVTIAGEPPGSERPALQPEQESPEQKIDQADEVLQSRNQEIRQKNQAADEILIAREVPVEKKASLRAERLPIFKGLSFKLDGGKWRRRLAKVWQASGNFMRRAVEGSKLFLLRLLPGVMEDVPGLSSGVMLFLAIAIPVIVVAVASTTYLRRGRNAEHERYIQQAIMMVTQAENQSDPLLKRGAWEETLKWLDVADTYGKSEDSNLIRDRVYHALDEMDGITRIEVLPAIQEEAFPSTVNISKMVASSSDVYLLDESEGRVLRMILTGEGYEVDSHFNCGPGPSGSNYIGPLIDMVPLPIYNINNAAILALDAKGNVLYCLPGETPLSSSLPPPYTDWVEIQSASLQYDTLYVLDVGTNAVWMYADPDMAFGEEPRLFFDEEVPSLMDQMIDLAIYEDDLFLLRQNGQMATCVFSNRDIDTTKCIDPAPYGDLRPGSTGEQLVFEGANFTQMQVTRPLDPSLFVLDMSSSAIYHFSLRLNLLRQFRPRSGAGELMPAGEPTAFVITPDHILLVAYGNQLYFAALP
jgi:hypothetical protein